jgi:hypothetical protein
MFVIPMAGMSSRFMRAGYTEPKYRLPAFGQSLFAHAVGSFARYFRTDRFLFITLRQFAAADFVSAECRRLGIASFDVVTLDTLTRGQAETVYLGLASAGVGREPLTIFNIDTAEVDFTHPTFVGECDGYLDVFLAPGDHWSFVAPAPGSDCRVAATAEKQRISALASTGLYHFASADDFRAACLAGASGDPAAAGPGELFVAPLYNHLIGLGRDIRYRLVDRDRVVLFGTPDEYARLLARPVSPFVPMGGGTA